MTARAKPPFELKGFHVLLMLLGFFGAVIAVNVAFAIAAVGTFPGEDVQRSYLQGLHYNETLAERRAQSRLGWRAAAGFSHGRQGAALAVTLMDHAGAPIDGAAIEGELERPTDSRLDRPLNFVQTGAGRYEAQLNELQMGRWRLRAHARSENEALDFESELTWRASH